MYVGLQPDVSKAYIKGGKRFVMSYLMKGEKSVTPLPVGDKSGKLGYYQPDDRICVVFQSSQLLPFAVIHFE